MADFGGDWADLPADLLTNILNRLDPVDFIRALAVCVAWRYLPAKSSHCRPSNSPIPWLLFSSPFCPHSLCFHTVLNPPSTERYYEIRLPQIAGRRRIGCSQGFLITTDFKDSTTIDATNLLTGARLPLPSATPDIVALVPDMVRDSEISSMLDEEAITLPNIKKHIKKMHYKGAGFTYCKAVISPSLDVVAALVHSSLKLSEDCSFLFRRVLLGRTGDASWIDLSAHLATNMPFLLFWTDILFHEGLLYAINNDGMLAVFDPNNPTAPPLINEDGCPVVDDGLLVESPDKNDLFFVHKNDIPDRFIESDSEDEESILKFEVFMLQKGSHWFERMRDLGEVAIFVSGKTCASSVSTREHPNLRKNCVYFTSLNHNEDFLGVYSLEDRNIERLVSGVSGRQRYYGSNPIWFSTAINRVKLCLL